MSAFVSDSVFLPLLCVFASLREIFGSPRKHLILFVLLLSLLSGCGKGGTAAGGAARGGHIAGVLRYPLTTDPATLDPALAADIGVSELLLQVYEGLVGWNEKNQLVPLLAAALPKVSTDGKVYTFTIRQGAKFTNGRQVTAEDVKYSLTRALDPQLNSPVALSYLDDIVGAKEYAKGKADTVSGIKVVNPQTVQITIVHPAAFFLGKMTYPTAFVVAKEEVEKGTVGERGARTIEASNSVGTGAFKLESYRRQSKLILTANPEYWGEKPKLTRIERPVILEPKTVRNLYDTGELDYINLTKADYAQDRQNPALKEQVRMVDHAGTWYVAMNEKHYKPFADKRVRQAIALAIDKDAIAQSVFLGVSAKANTILPPGMLGYDAKYQAPAYDLEKAKALLAQAGYPNGVGMPPLTLLYIDKSPDFVQTAQVLKEQIAKIGVPISIVSMESAKFNKDQQEKQYDCSFTTWFADYLDPQDFLSLLLMSGVPYNYTEYANPAFDALCKQADVAQVNRKRAALYAKADKIAVEDAAWVPIVYVRDLHLAKPYVRGVRTCLMGHLPFNTVRVD